MVTCYHLWQRPRVCQNHDDLVLFKWLGARTSKRRAVQVSRLNVTSRNAVSGMLADEEAHHD